MTKLRTEPAWYHWVLLIALLLVAIFIAIPIWRGQWEWVSEFWFK